MSPNLLYILLGAFAAGLLLLLLGVKGRRINNHPICRGCKFDLDGVYPECITCPECGSGLKRDNAVQKGARTRLWSVVTVGALLTVTPLVPLGALAVAAITGRDLDKFKPVGLLMWEAKHADSIRTGKIAGELLSRVLTKSLSADQYNTVIDFTLALQADSAVAWSETWGDIIDQAKLDRVLTQAQEDSFAQHALTLKIEGRTKVRAGDAVPLVVSVVSKRVGSASSMLSSLAINGVKWGSTLLSPVAAAPAEPRSFDVFSNFDPFRRSQKVTGALGVVNLTGARAAQNPFGIASGGSAQFGLLYEIPEQTEPGTYPLTLDLDVSTSAGDRGGGFAVITLNGIIQPTSQGGQTHRVTLSLPLEVVPKDKAVITVSSPTDQTTQKLTDRLRPKELAYRFGSLASFFDAGRQGHEPGYAADIALNAKDLPTAVAFDVICRFGEDEYVMGQLTNGKLPPKPDADNSLGKQSGFTSSSFTFSINGKTITSSSNSSAPANPDDTIISATLPVRKGDTADIILRPSQSVAASTLDLKDYYGQEIVFKDVPVNKSELAAVQPALRFPTRQPQPRSRNR